jgi:hypothetical protein
MVWPWHGGRLLTAHCRDSGEQLQTGAHAREGVGDDDSGGAREGTVFWHNAAQVASHWGIRASTAQREKGRHDEVAPRGRADPPADEVQSVSLLCRLTKDEDLLTI